jgi:hypothetical protein
MPSKGKCAVHVWLIKPEGLYDTYETSDIDLDDWFEDEEWELKLGSHRGWHFRSVRR